MIIGQILVKHNWLLKCRHFSRISSINSIDPLRFKSTASYPVYNVELECFKNYYRRRPEGLKLNVEYCDTKDLVNNKEDVITILGVHGSPGRHNDYKYYIEELTKKFNVRFIMANFPGLETCDRYPIYKHRVEERAIFLNDFLKHINLENGKVDMLLCHSGGGVFVPLYLWDYLRAMPDNQLKEIRSFAFFNAPGYQLMKSMKPRWLTRILGEISVYKLGRKLFLQYGPKFLKLTGFKLDLDKKEELLLSLMAMNSSKVYLFKNYLKRILDEQLPVLYVFSEDDRLIQKEMFYEISEELNLKKQDIVIYDESTKLEQLGDLTKTNQAVAFRKGGHFCFIKHERIVCDYLVHFIKRNLIKKKTKKSK